MTTLQLTGTGDLYHYDDEVTPALLESLGVEYTKDDPMTHDVFTPLSPNEVRVFGDSCTDFSAELVCGSFINYTQLVMDKDTGKKSVVFIAREGDWQDSDQALMEEQVPLLRKSYVRLGHALGAEPDISVTMTADNTSIEEYEFQLQVPVERFDGLTTGPQFKKLMETCSFNDSKDFQDSMTAIIAENNDALLKRTYFHGTSLTNAKKILKDGLVNPLPHDPNWFLLATDIESAKIYQKQCEIDKKHHYIIEFEVGLPQEDLENEIMYTGYPMLWPEYKFNDDKIWVSPRETVPTSCIVGIYKMDLETKELTKLNISNLAKSQTHQSELAC